MQARHATKLRLLLTALNNANNPNDMNAPHWNLHSLHKNLKGHWAVSVNGSWRITFKFQDGNAEIVDYQNYH
nr:type II toxin-antitoxin system RelE/ParE family toxin [Pelistega sp. MC2]